MPDRPRRCLPAQHREPGAPVDRALPPVRRRRHGPRRRLPRREGLLPQPVRAHRRAASPSRRRGSRCGPGLPSRPTLVAARGRLGCARQHEGRVEHRRHRAPRHGADELLPVRRPLPARPAVGRDARQGDVERPVPLRLGRLRAPEGRRPHRRAALLQLQQGGAVHALRRRRRGRRPGPLRRRTAARPATAARHGLHRELRDPQRLPALLGAGGCSPRARTSRASTPTCRRRFAVIPRRGQTSDIRWFEADPTYVLHFVNAYEDGDEIVLDGFFQGDPEPQDNGMGNRGSGPSASSPSTECRPVCTGGGSTCATGLVKEEPLSDSITEFGMINGAYAGRKYRYAYAATGKPALVPLRRARQARPADGRRGAVLLRRRRLRQRDRDGAAGRRARPRTTATSSR